MSESDTPRTDAAEITVEFGDHPMFKSITYVTPDFAATLERELNRWREMAENMHAEIIDLRSEASELRRELRETR